MPRPLHLAAASAALALSLAVAGAASASPELRVDGRHFKDASGRVVLLRGVNVAGDSKVPPFTAASDPAIFDPLAAWGMNAIRLLFNWEAYETSPGVYDQAYLDYYVSAAKEAWKRGIYVIADVHQDAYSRWSLDGCGEGFPKWSLPKDVTPATPDNGPSCADWGTRAASDMDMQKAFTDFYADTYGVRTRYLAMLKSLAAALESNAGVIGYDMLNEPWGDEATEVAKLHEDGAASIRSVSPTAILFLSPVALTSAGLPTKLPAPTFTNAVYSPHFYLGSVNIFRSWSGDKPDDAFAQMDAKAASWTAPLLVGEFGASSGTKRGLAYVDAIYDELDRVLASGTQWVYSPHWSATAKDGWNTEDFSIVDGTGAIRDNFHARPYAQKIAGTPTLLKVTHPLDPAQSTVELDWTNDPGAGGGVTEMFVPAKDLFGSAAASTEATGASCTLDGTKLTCTSSVAGPAKVIVRAATVAPAAASAKGCTIAADAGARPGGFALVAAAALASIASVARAAGRRRRA